MHGNAATVAILLVLAATGEARLSTPVAPAAPVAPVAVVVTVATPVAPATPQATAATPVAPAPPLAAPTTPVVQAVAPVIPAARAATPAAPAVAPVAPAAKAPAVQAPADPVQDKDVVRKALAVAGRTYEALHAAADGRIQGPGSGSRVEQAKQIIAQLRSAAPPPPIQKAPVPKAPVQPLLAAPAATAATAAPAAPAATAAPVTKKFLDAELLDAEAQVKNKLTELNVQTRLEKEKEEAGVKVQKRAVELRDRATKLRKEADVAAKIAKEKAEAAAKADTGVKQTEIKAKKILEEEHVMQRFLNQTKKEEIALERNVSNLKIEETKAVQREAASAVVKTVPKKVPAPTAKVAVPMDHEAMKKLVEENSRLKHEKAVSEQQLSDRKVAKEKSKLKQKLKNRLALADRHMKLQKRMLRVRH